MQLIAFADNNGNNKTAYLRGRKLNGKAVTLPEGYRGVVLRREDENRRCEQDEVDMQISGNQQEEEGKEEQGPPTGEMRVMAEFDEMVVWAHGDLPDGATDPYLRSVEEWSQFASKVCGSSDVEQNPEWGLLLT